MSIKKQKGKKKVIKKAPTKAVKRRRIKYKNVFLFLLVLLVLFIIARLLLQVSISNIYIRGNHYLKDQSVIELLDLQDYPPVIQTIFGLEKKATKNALIKSIKVKHKGIRTLDIEVEENIPLFYDSTKQKNILKDEREIDGSYPVPVLLNYVPDKKYKKLKKKMTLIDTTILNKISEMKYDPNDKDDERFLLSMNDGNYVYVTLGYFEKIDNYLSIMIEMQQKFHNQKGILYLDSGGYFQVLENR